MADRVRKINYCYAKVSARAGQGAAMPFSLALLDDLAWMPLVLAVAAILVWVAPNSLEIIARLEDGRLGARWAKLLMPATGLAAAVSVFTIFSTGSYEFIYFQF